MQLLDAITSRRAVKSFQPGLPMSDAEIEQLFTWVQMTPTAFNQQHYRFVVVKDQTLRQKIREAAWDQAQVTDCSALVVVCGYMEAWKQIRECWQGAPDAVIDWMDENATKFYENNPQMMRDEAMRSCGMAAQTIMLAAQELGYDTCPMDGFDFDKVGELINLPDDHLISMFVAIGKPKQPPKPRPFQLPQERIVIEDRFPS